MPEDKKAFERIPLQSNDGNVIIVDYDVATRSALLSTMLDDLKSMGVTELGPVPLPNVCPASAQRAPSRPCPVSA